MPSRYLGGEIPGGGRAATPKFLRRRPVDRRSRRTANKSTKGGILKDYERRHIWVTQMALKSCTAGRWHSNCTRRGSCPAYFTSKQRPSRIKLRSVSCKTTVFSQAKWVKTISVKWDKFEDTIAVQFLSASSAPKKREVLAKLAKVYDPLGLASPITLQGKQIYRDGCDCKVSLDAAIPENLKIRWQMWEQSLLAEVTIRRPSAPYQQPVISAELHVFGDAWTYGVGAAVYSVVRQEDWITQTLVAAKTRLAKRELTVPRLELVSAHRATNFVISVRNGLKKLPEPTIYGWLDSTVALLWIVINGQYPQFVSKRVQKIRQYPQI